MTPTEAAALLTVAAAFDNRKPDADAAKAWSLALSGLSFVECRDAVVAHYTRTKDWIMPADIRTLVRRVRDKRIAEDTDLNPPAGLDPDRTGDYARWLVQAREEAASGQAPTPKPIARHNVAELGQIGSPVVSDARAAVAEARTASDAAKRALREAKAARMAAAREADRKARAGKSEEGAA